MELECGTWSDSGSQTCERIAFNASEINSADVKLEIDVESLRLEVKYTLKRQHLEHWRFVCWPCLFWQSETFGHVLSGATREYPVSDSTVWPRSPADSERQANIKEV